MIPNGIDLLRWHLEPKESAPHGTPFRPERRKRARTRVHWPVRLLKNGSRTEVTTVTENLSSSGFYCLLATPLTPGEALTWTLTAPAYDPKSAEKMICIACRPVVMRAEATPAVLY